MPRIYRTLPIFFSLALALSVFSETALAQTVPVVFSNPGTHSWTVPPKVTKIKVKIWGAGGGGGTGWRDEKDDENRGGAGGGGGGYAESDIIVEPNTTFSILVGAGGRGHSKFSTVVPAGNSEFSRGGTVLVGAGGGGGGGFAGLSRRESGQSGAAGRGQGGVVGGLGAGAAGLGVSSGGGIGATGGGGGSGYMGDIKYTGGTALETIDRGDNEDSTSGAVGARGGNGGVAGRCGRNGGGHHCSSGRQASRAGDGESPGGGGGGSSTGWEDGDIAGFGANGKVVIEILESSEPNSAPSIPSCTVEPASATVSSSFTFTAQSSDPEGDTLKYEFNWGEGGVSNRPATGYVQSGTSQSVSKSWSAAGTYTVKVKAVDSKGSASAEADCSVNVTKPVINDEEKPDLAASSPNITGTRHPDSTDFKKGEDMIISAAIYNLGTVAAVSAFPNYFAWSGSYNGPFAPLSPNHSVNGLVPKGGSVISQSVKSLAANSGTYYFIACADGPSGVIDEGANEENNCSTPVRVVVRGDNDVPQVFVPPSPPSPPPTPVGGNPGGRQRPPDVPAPISDPTPTAGCTPYYKGNVALNPVPLNQEVEWRAENVTGTPISYLWRGDNISDGQGKPLRIRYPSVGSKGAQLSVDGGKSYSDCTKRVRVVAQPTFREI